MINNNIIKIIIKLNSDISCSEINKNIILISNYF